MSDPVEAFRQCCDAVLRGDTQLLEQLRAHGFNCEPGFWVFSQADLHGYFAASLSITYEAWLQRVYASEINTYLRGQGAEIAIHDNLGKVALNLYCLRRVTA